MSAHWYGGRPMMKSATPGTDLLYVSGMIDEPAAKTPRREPRPAEWRCARPCGRIHKRAVEECAACGMARPT